MLLEVTELDKKFNGVYALNKLALFVRAGEIHGLVGENGAGKSTLIKILGGVYAADGGQLKWEGRAFPETFGPAESRKLGISVLYQENVLVPAFSGVENIGLGRPYPTKNGRILWKEMEGEAAAKAGELGIRPDLAKPAAELTPPQKKCVEIIRAMMGECRLLILDEPTASLTGQETAMLFAVMRRLTAGGTAILYVSHRLEEVLSLTDRVTVLRNGETAAVLDTGEATKELLIRHMSGGSGPEVGAAAEREAAAESTAGKESEAGAAAERGPAAGAAAVRAPAAGAVFRRQAGPGGIPALEVRGLSSRDGLVKNVSLTAFAGRITGIFGLCGSGRTELLECIYGCRRIKSGEVLLNGVRFKRPSPPRAMQNGMVFICEDRRGRALMHGRSLFDNMMLGSLDRFSRRGRFACKEAESRAREMLELLKIKCTGLTQPIDELSGGNQQKVIFARALLTKPAIWLCDEPTQAVDVATRQELHRLLRAEADGGRAVVYVSSDLTELLEVADEVAVMARGTLAARLPNDGLRPEEVLAWCYGTGGGREAV